MKNLTFLVAMVLLSCSLTSQVTATWWHYPYCTHWSFPSPGKAFPPLPAVPFKPPPEWSFPTPGKALPPLPPNPFQPPVFHPPPEVATCLSDGKDVRTCFTNIVKGFYTGKPALGTDCCAVVEKMDEDCDKLVFGAFNDHFFKIYVKLHCSTQAATTPPAPSTPSTPSAPSPA